MMEGCIPTKNGLLGVMALLLWHALSLVLIQHGLQLRPHTHLAAAPRQNKLRKVL
jgi:hypothetical protein